MSEIPDIPKVEVNGTGIPLIRVDSAGIQFIGSRRINNQSINRVGVRNIADARIWLVEPSQAIPVVVPVTERVGTPIVNMPGCVKVSKENSTKFEGNKNKMLVNDDPKGNVVLCDAGAPYYEPPDYDYRELTWQTITQEQEEASQELDTVVEEMLITLRLSGQKQLYCFDVTNDPAVRNAVLASLGDDYDDQEQEEN